MRRTSAAASTLDVACGFEQPQEQVPEVVDQQAEARCQCGGVALAAAEPIIAPLVFELIKDVLRVGALAVELDDLPRVDPGRLKVGDIDRFSKCLSD